MQNKFELLAIKPPFFTPNLLHNSKNKSMTNYHLQTQQKAQTNHYNHKENETKEATFLATIVFISLIIFIFQS